MLKSNTNCLDKNGVKDNLQLIKTTCILNITNNILKITHL